MQVLQVLTDYPDKPLRITITMEFGLNVSPDQVVERTLVVMNNIPWLPVAYGRYESKYNYNSGIVTITFFHGNKYPSEDELNSRII